MRSTFKDDLRCEVDEPVDKVFFSRRDEEFMYAEAYFKNKVLPFALIFYRSWSAGSDTSALLSYVLLL